MADEESIALRKKLLGLDKNEVAKKCKKKSLSTGGTKTDMVDRLVEYNAENGGVTGAREGSNKNKKKKGSTAGGADSKKSDKKRSKSGGGRSGGGGGGGGGRSNGGSRGGGGGRSNTGDDGGGGGGCYCNCGGDGDAEDENPNQNMRRIIGGILGVICLLLIIVAMGVNVLSRYSTTDFTVTCRWSEVRGCDANDNCQVVTFDYDCDACGIDEDCKSCKTQKGGQAWLAFNILALICLLVGVVLVFAGHFSLKAQAFVNWAKIFYIVSAVFLFIGVVAWVGANSYNASCYDPDNDLGLGTSNIIDIITGCLLVIGFLLVF